MDKRKYISSATAIEVLIVSWITAILIGILDAPWWLAGCVVTAGIAFSEARYSVKIDNERKELE